MYTRNWNDDKPKSPRKLVYLPFTISKENNLVLFNTYFLCILNYICIIQNYG